MLFKVLFSYKYFFTKYVRILTVQVLVAARLPMSLLSPSLVNSGESGGRVVSALSTGPNTPRGQNHDDGINQNHEEFLKRDAGPVSRA